MDNRCPLTEGTPPRIHLLFASFLLAESMGLTIIKIVMCRKVPLLTKQNGKALPEKQRREEKTRIWGRPLALSLYIADSGPCHSEKILQPICVFILSLPPVLNNSLFSMRPSMKRVTASYTRASKHTSWHQNEQISVGRIYTVSDLHFQREGVEKGSRYLLTVLMTNLTKKRKKKSLESFNFL